jgi:hypothetical protein
MRWCLALGIVLAALIAATVKVAARRPRPVMATHTDESDRPEALPESAPSPTPSLTASRQWRAAPARSAAGELFGRVLAPPGEETSFEGLTVVADGGQRTIEARVFPDGRFTIHLPAGPYALTATLDDWVGSVPNVGARPDRGREVAIQLGPPAAIRGHVRGPDGSAIMVRASLAGHRERQEGTVDGDGDFAFEQLLPGRVYDLTFEGAGLRTTTLRSVMAPAQEVAASVVALPVLRGAVGFPPGEHCPITRVALYAPSALSSSNKDDAEVNEHCQEGDDGEEGSPDESDEGDEVDENCRFQLPVPDGPTGMILVASGTGWHLEEPVSIPPLGDPEPVCLNPPCRAGFRGPTAEDQTTIEEEFFVQ